MQIVDSHHHLWDPEWLPYTWTRSRPAFNRSFRLSDCAASYLETMQFACISYIQDLLLKPNPLSRKA
jgi:predicted TIM-barrel fold metal-dependent hydrolase